MVINNYKAFITIKIVTNGITNLFTELLVLCLITQKLKCANSTKVKV